MGDTIWKGWKTGKIAKEERHVRTVSLSPQRKRQKRRANIRHNASDNDLLLARCLDRCSELGVVPCTVVHALLVFSSFNPLRRRVGGWEHVLYFSLSLHKWRVGIHLQDLLGQRAVGTLLRGGGHDDGEVEKLAKLGVRQNVLAVEGGVPVATELVETDLQVQDEEHLSGKSDVLVVLYDEG